MVYNYTKPRGPIAAMYSSPGPCYSLPGLVGYPNHDPRSNHVREAQWSFGVRHGKFKDDCGPGPAYFPDPHVSRTGRDGTPQYSLHSRTKESTIFANPGPGAYNPTSGDPHVYPKAPQCSLGYRHKEFRTDDVPGPNCYVVDPMLGKTVRSQKQSAPAYTLSGRTKIFGSSETPGAGAYKVVDLNLWKEAPPKYSLTAKNLPPSDATRKPGPGAYHPETVRMDKRSAPQFSFGIRHSQYKGEFITDADKETN